ncbi:E3 ubiquitin-protein ligase TRIM71-like [Dysidea avara]|uniref:E3 ubiquitin-protein ligase TRIM71-like n=1 Tax=Dysidea avara TaxID=196820 RepID=UPI0033344D0E
MAAKKMKLVAGHLTCPVCYELYKKPKYLPCYHSYCEECLAKLQVGSNITCPECRITSVVPSGGVKNLPNNFFINRIVDEIALKEKLEGDEDVKCDNCIRDDPGIVLCVDCGVFLCNHCHESHKYSREYQGHHMMMLKEIRSERKDVIVRPKPKPMLCEEHDLELNFYCETCEQLVCHYCTTMDHRLEDGHKHNTARKMASKQRAELDKIMEPVEKMINGLAKAHKKVSSTRDRIGSQATEVEQQIDVYYEQLQQRLQQQREDLKKELREVSTQKKKSVSLQLEQMEYTQAQLESVKELSEAVKSGSDQEALFVKKQVAEDVKRLTSDYNKLNTEPVESSTLEFGEYDKSFPIFGRLLSSEYKLLNFPEHVVKGRETKFQVVSSKHPYNKTGRQITVQAQPRTDVITVPVKDNQDGSYTAFFVANQTGEVKLSISINGEHIKGSPFSVQVHQYSALDKPNKIVNDGGRMGKPWGIAFGKDGVWAVADHYNHCVCIFDSQDQLVRRFGSKGLANGQFDSPAGLAFDANNHLYVVERYNDRVQKFDINGGYLLKFGKKGNGNGELDCPLGIALHNDIVFVADQCNHRISVFQCDGQFMHIIGSGKLDRPFDLAVTNINQVLVADWDRHCISIFTLDGNYVGMFGTQGSDRGQLNKPSGITVDLYGFIMVTEEDNHRVSIFDKYGVFIHCFGSRGSSAGQFSSPCGIACSPNGSVYVSDCVNKRIQIFSDY